MVYPEHVKVPTVKDLQTYLQGRISDMEMQYKLYEVLLQFIKENEGARIANTGNKRLNDKLNTFPGLSGYQCTSIIWEWNSCYITVWDHKLLPYDNKCKFLIALSDDPFIRVDKIKQHNISFSSIPEYISKYKEGLKVVPKLVARYADIVSSMREFNSHTKKFGLEFYFGYES